MAGQPGLPLSGWWYQLSPQTVLTDRPPGFSSSGEVRVLVIDPGGAFPLGHPTTRLCLDLLVKAFEVQPAGRLLEIGCGSGVLSLAAALLGVPQVLAVDIAWPAVQASRENARRLGLHQAVSLIQGSSDCLMGAFGMVVANLPMAVQLAKATELAALAGPDGRLLLSGFREPDEATLLPTYRQQGWELQERVVKYFSHPELPATVNFNWVAWLLRHARPGEEVAEPPVEVSSSGG